MRQGSADSGYWRQNEARFCRQWLLEVKRGKVLQTVVTGGKTRQGSADSGYWR
jgi:hypothetical protein